MQTGQFWKSLQISKEMNWESRSFWSDISTILTSVLTIISIWLPLTNSCCNSLRLTKSLTLSMVNKLWLKFNWTVFRGRFFGICTKVWFEQSTEANSLLHLHPFGHACSIGSGKWTKMINLLYKRSLKDSFQMSVLSWSFEAIFVIQMRNLVSKIFHKIFH